MKNYKLKNKKKFSYNKIKNKMKRKNDMKKEFGKLKGIPVYKVEKFDSEIKNQGFIQLIDNGDRFWKICTNSPIADGVYDSVSGNTSIYDESELNMGIKELKYNRQHYKAKEPVTEECVECLLPELDVVIDNIMGDVAITCDDLMSKIEVVG